MPSPAGPRSGRRIARGIASLAVLVAAGWAVASGVASGSASAEEYPSVRFTGSVNAAGMLDGINLSPQSVSVPPGGAVSFVNASGTALTLSVGGLEVAIPDGQTRTLSFPGTDSERDVAAAATAVDLPLIGAMSSSTATVKVGARRAAPDPQPGSNDPSTDPSASAGSPAPLPALSGGQTVPSAGASRGSSASPTASGRALAERGAAPRRSQAASSTDAAVNGNFSALPEATGSRKGTRVTTVGGGGSMLGLLILVATVLLGGVGAAAIRSVLALRDGPPARR